MNPQYLFPYENIRDEQNKLIEDISKSLQEKKHMLINAPTGLGKTISSLGPALKFAIDNDLTVFFLTPKHSQHKIAIETLRDIKEKFNIQFNVADFIGKKNMCSQPGIDKMHSSNFPEFCSKLVQDRKCRFYNNTKKGEGVETFEAGVIVDELIQLGPIHTQDVLKYSKEKEMCAYEVAALLAKKARVIVADYHHLLNPNIRERFMKRCDKHLGESIIIIDEGHNLPDRARDILSVSLNSFVLNASIREADKYEYEETKKNLEKIKDVIIDLSSELNYNIKETTLPKNKLIEAIEQVISIDINEFVADLDFISDEIREEKELSFIGSIAKFLKKWQGDDFGYVRVLKKDRSFDGETKFEINYNCLDPAFITKPLIEESYSTIIMSGTLNPSDMYFDLLGFPANTFVKSYNSPFKNENRLTMVIPETTTKYSDRNPEQFKRIAQICVDITNEVPGNCAIFFPSYSLRNDIYNCFVNSKKTIFMEEQGLNKEEKNDLLERFKNYKDTGAILLGAVGGSFAEGIDLPGDYLKCVIVVGVPLGMPDMETKYLIEYYDKKFGKGWDYGYSMPAMTKCIQGAGRCIRSETDKGVMVFLDKRFSWSNYHKMFPKDWDLKVSMLYLDRVKEFYSIK